jgi:hypothetical protein
MSNKNKGDLSLVDMLHLCRHFGVRRFKNSSMELEFHEGLPQLLDVSPEAAKPPTKDDAYEQKALEGTDAPKVGADGLTAEQQREVYGGVMDPEIR